MALRASIGRALWSLSWPIALAHELSVLILGIGLYWLGHIGGDTALVVEAAFRPFGFLFVYLFSAAAVGTSVLVTRSVGANDERGLDVAAAGAMLGGAMWLAFAVIAGCASPWLIDALAGGLAIDKPLMHYFIGWLLLALPGLIFAELFLDVANATGHTKLNLLRIALDLALTIGLTPLLMHAIGIAGAPAAEGLSTLALSVVLWRMLVRRGRALGLGALGPDAWRVRWSLWREILRIGLPVQVGRVVMFLAQIVLVQLVMHDGGGSVAGYGIATFLLFLVTMVTMGLARGGAILAGMSIGAGMHDRARKSVIVTLVAGWAIVAILIFPLPLFERALIGLFSSEPPTIERAERALMLLRWSAFGIATWQVLLASFAAYGATMRASLLIILGEVCGLATAYAWPGSRLDGACVAWIVASSVKGLLLIALVLAGRLRVTRVASDA